MYKVKGEKNRCECFQVICLLCFSIEKFRKCINKLLQIMKESITINKEAIDNTQNNGNIKNLYLNTWLEMDNALEMYNQNHAREIKKLN